MVSQRACSGKPNFDWLWSGEKNALGSGSKAVSVFLQSFGAVQHLVIHARSMRAARRSKAAPHCCVYLAQHRIVIREAASPRNTSRQLYRARGRVRMFAAPTGPIKRPVPHRRTRTSTSPGLGPTGSWQQLHWRNRTQDFYQPRKNSNFRCSLGQAHLSWGIAFNGNVKTRVPIFKKKKLHTFDQR